VVSVEFLPSDDAPGLPPVAPVASHRHWWWLLGAAALVIAAVAYGLTRPSSPQHQAQPRFAGVPDCRGVPDCAVRSRVPAKIARLTRTDLPPGAQVRVRSVVSVDSITHEELLVSRTITATTDWVTITIQLRRGSNGEVRQVALSPLSFRSVSLHRFNSGYAVRLVYLAPASIPPRIDRLRALIRDPRLATS
jgi:hypothetical protein